MSKHESFQQIAKSKDLSELSAIIADTNNKLKMAFKREHKYNM
jgi:hypothetical protein